MFRHMVTEHALPDLALADALASIAQRLAPGVVGYRPLVLGPGKRSAYEVSMTGEAAAVVTRCH